MSSTRLPGKVMRDLAGAPMTERQIERVRRARRLDGLLIATSIDASDDPLAQRLERGGVAVHRGPLDDVLGRFVGALDVHPADQLVRLTADCPLADPEVIDALIAKHLHEGNDWTTAGGEARTFPVGLDCEAVRASILREAAVEAADPYEREHVTPFIYRRPERYRLARLDAPQDHGRLRWTVDTPEDFAFVQAVYAALYPSKPAFSSAEVLAFVRTRPDLMSLGGEPRGVISLRDLRPDDVQRLLDWRNSPAVAPYMYTDRPITPDEHARWFASAPTDPRRRYWLIELDGAPVGLVNLYDVDPGHRRCAWAYYLAEPSTRGRGVGAAVEFAMLDHVFGPMGLNKLWCEVLEENKSVWRLHESFGFTVEARFREHIRRGERYLDVLGLGLLAGDWARTRPTPLERLSSKGLIPPVVPE